MSDSHQNYLDTARDILESFWGIDAKTRYDAEKKLVSQPDKMSAWMLALIASRIESVIGFLAKEEIEKQARLAWVSICKSYKDQLARLEEKHGECDKELEAFLYNCFMVCI